MIRAMVTHAPVRRLTSSENAPLILLSLAIVSFHTLANSQYGFHRDELQTIANARTLAWGYVEYPPLTAFLARVELELFGTSLRGIRFFATMAEAMGVFFTGLAARELGGTRYAQTVAATAVAVGGHSLFSGSFLSYTSFDYLWWVLAAFFVIRLLRTDDPRWWIAIGVTIGVGMLTKYTIALLAIGIVAGVLLTPVRRHLLSVWLWCGLALAVVLMLPNLFWQVQHHFVYFEFVRSIHARDVSWGRADYFLLNQLWKSANPVTVPLWLAGLYFVFRSKAGKHYRVLGWMYLVPLLALLITRGRDYYLAPAYPMLIAAGAMFGEQWLRTHQPATVISIRQSVAWTLASAGLITVAVSFPLAPLNSTWWRVAEAMNGNFSYEIGWPELVQAVSKVHSTLPASGQASVGILVHDDGQAGALNLFGPSYHLPRAMSGMNTNWLRGYTSPPPQTVIVFGFGRDFLDSTFQSCEVAGKGTNPFGIDNGALRTNSPIFVCRHLRQAWPDFWRDFQYFG